MFFPLILAATVPPPIQAETKAHFEMELFDAESARWKFEDYRGDFLVCGYVNAKNRMGAYVGFQPFYFNAKDGTGRIYAPGEDAWLFRTLCFGDPPSD